MGKEKSVGTRISAAIEQHILAGEIGRLCAAQVGTHLAKFERIAETLGRNQLAALRGEAAGYSLQSEDPESLQRGSRRLIFRSIPAAINRAAQSLF